MSDQETTSLRSLFEQALTLEGEARERFLRERCPDITLRTRLQRMLATDGSDDALHLAPAAALAQAIGESDFVPTFPPGSKIGPFTISEVIGEGGSSTVFRAWRDVDGARQDVAVKLLRRGLFSADAQRQFRRERIALAQLQHPNIARLIEGGISDAGLAYIALELVDGQPITDFARTWQLDLRERIKLLLQVCRAVESAHRALIVHRDLKPSNVLVAANGEVKLLDFGIAKLLDEDDTQTRMPVFTPAYAAPEQVVSGAITTATDVYALGILLGELVTGQRLHEGGSRTPSARINDDSAPGVLSSSPQLVRRQLRGDLDNIVLKAIDELPERRYASAGALAEDLERFLEGRPVAAHPPSSWYRASKFVSRHRGAVASTMLFLLGIFAALGIALWQANVARHEAQRANTVRAFLIGIFDAAKANLPRNERPTPEILVAEAAKRAREDPDIDTPLRADLLRTLGTVALTMGDFSHAESLLDEAIKRGREAGLAPGSEEWIDTLVQKGNLLQRTGRNTEADQLMAGILADLRRQDSQAAVSGLMLFATTQLSAGHAENAIAISEEMVTKARRILPVDSLDAIKTATFPGQLSVNARRYKESVPLLEPVIARWRELGLQQDEDFAQAIGNLAVAKERAGDRAAGESLYRETIALRRRIYAQPHHELATSLEKLAIFLIKQEKFEEAHTLLEEALEMSRKTLGPEHNEVASTLDTLGVLEGTRREFVASEQHLREAVRIYVANAAAAGDEEDLGITRSHLAQTLLNLGKLEEAQAMNASALANIIALHGEDHDLTAAGRYISARIALAQHNPTSALEIADRTLAGLAKQEVPNLRVETLNYQVRAQALDALERREEALVALQIAIEKVEKASPDAHAKRASLQAFLARLQTALGKPEEAAAAIAKARALNVPAALLSAQDNATLNTP